MESKEQTENEVSVLRKAFAQFSQPMSNCTEAFVSLPKGLKTHYVIKVKYLI